LPICMISGGMPSPAIFRRGFESRLAQDRMARSLL
jgi:hypothetical protein